MPDDEPKIPPAVIDAAPPWVKTIIDGQTAIQAEVYGMKEQLRLQNGRVTSLEESNARHSGGVDQLKSELKQNSKADQGQDAAIADIVVKVGAMEAQVQTVHKVVTGLAQNPTVLWAGRLFVLLLAGYAANKGIKVLP